LITPTLDANLAWKITDIFDVVQHFLERRNGSVWLHRPGELPDGSSLCVSQFVTGDARNLPTLEAKNNPQTG
jgi:hypothetical protein